MKRTALTRRTPLRNTKPLQRKTRLRKVRHDRIRARRARDFGAQAELCRTMPCCSCWQVPTVPHHEPPRSCGGHDSATVPLCDACHRERHNIGRVAFEKRHRIDLVHEAARMAELVSRGSVNAA